MRSEHPPRPKLEFRLLRAPEVYQNGIVNKGPTATKARALLYYLAMTGRTHTRAALAALLWGDQPDSAARSNLRKVLLELNATLPEYLIIDRQGAGFRNRECYWVDAIELATQVSTLGSDSSSNVTALQQAIALYGGDFLEGFYVRHAPDFEAWMLAERVRLRGLLIRGLKWIAEYHAGQGDLAQAINSMQRVLVMEPWQEESHRQLIGWLAQSGQRAAALAQYERCVEALADELDVEPSAATCRLYESLLRDEPGGDGPTGHNTPVEYRLAGRRSHWQLLESTWQKAQREQSHFVCVAGEPGIGKTRLVEELLIYAQQQGYATARARAYALEGRLAFAPVADWLRSAQLKRTLPTLDKIWLSEITRLLPELLVEYPELPAPQPLTERWQQRRLFDALARVFAAAQRPLLLLLDDLQWCDAETLEWLQYFFRSAPRTHVLVAGTVRNEEVDEDHPLHNLLRQLTRDGQLTMLPLPRLSKGETAELAELVAKRSLDADVTNRLYQETGGNALFVIEMMRASEESPDRHSEDPSTPKNSLPPKVFAIIEERLARLSPQARTFANLAAVVGRDFSTELLARSSEEDEASIIPALEELWRRGIIREHGQGYDFSHDKIREVAYRELKPMRRRLFHRQIGQALETLHAHSLGEIAGELAVHFEEGGETRKARAYYQVAGERALANYANGTALAYLTQALALTPESEKRALYQLYSLRRTIYQRQAESEADAKELALMREIAESIEDEEEALRCRAEVAANFAHHKAMIGDYERAIESSRQAVELAKVAGALDVEADAYRRWAYAYWAQAKYVQARDLLLQSLALAKKGDLRAMQADCLGVISSCGLFTGIDLYDQTMAYLDDALTLFQESGDRIGEALTLNRQGYVLVTQGEGIYAQAEAKFHRALQISRNIGNPTQEAVALGNLGVLYNCQGDYARSLGALRQGIAITEGTGDVRQHGATLTYMGVTLLNQGDYSQAQSALEMAYEVLHPNGIRQWEVKALSEQGLLYHYRGEHERALVYLDQAVAIVRTYGDLRQEARVLTRRGHVCLALGKIAEAKASYQRALSHHEKMEQRNRRMEPLAGLARIAFLEGNHVQAHKISEGIFVHLQGHRLDHTDDVLMVYLACYDLLCHYQDPRSLHVLEMAHTQLQARAATIEAGETCKLFWNAPSHRTVLDATVNAAQRRRQTEKAR